MHNAQNKYFVHQCRMQLGYVQKLGLLLFLYGLFKVMILVALLFALPKHTQKQLAKLPGVNLLITGDATIAGRAGEIVLGVFGVFTMVHGLALMGFLPVLMTRILESKTFQYTIYIVFGAALVIFYSLVLYSQVPIPKKEENRKLYWTYGYIGGASFLLIPILWESFARLLPIFQHMSLRGQLATITLTLLVASFVAYTIVMAV